MGFLSGPATPKLLPGTCPWAKPCCRLRLRIRIQKRHFAQIPRPTDRPTRTRFAPSPTGLAHLGSLRTALFNYLLAKAYGGQFVLRIEDTDQGRIRDGAVQDLYENLKWAGLTWDEGPDLGGPYGPYQQSLRLDRYRTHARQLLASEKAYRCFCDHGKLDSFALDAAASSSPPATRYPGNCRSIPDGESAARAAGGERHVVRFKSDRAFSFVDAVYGPYRKRELEEDFVLVKSDGFPTYHFANVVDDHAMQITHVIRGEEWLISTPKHIALYDAFSWRPPVFAHLGLLVGPDGEKLSKRMGDVHVGAYRAQGFLPMALANWLALHGSRLRGGGGKTEVVRDMPALVERLSYEFTRGGITPNFSKLAHLHSAHVGLLRDGGEEGRQAVDGLLVDPVIERIRQIDGLIHSAGNRDAAVTCRDGSASMPAAERDLSHEMAAVHDPGVWKEARAGPGRPTGRRVRDAIVAILLDSNKRLASPVDVVVHYAALIWRPTLAEQEAGHAAWRAAEPDCRLDPVDLWTDVLDAGAEACADTRHLLGRVGDAIARSKAKAVAGVSSGTEAERASLDKAVSRAAHQLMRLGLTASHDRPGSSTMKMVEILGGEEVKIRLTRARQVSGGLGPGKSK